MSYHKNILTLKKDKIISPGKRVSVEGLDGVIKHKENPTRKDRLLHDDAQPCVNQSAHLPAAIEHCLTESIRRLSPALTCINEVHSQPVISGIQYSRDRDNAFLRLWHVVSACRNKCPLMVVRHH